MRSLPASQWENKTTAILHVLKATQMAISDLCSQEHACVLTSHLLAISDIWGLGTLFPEFTVTDIYRMGSQPLCMLLRPAKPALKQLPYPSPSGPSWL